jgi:hypothetical protein
MLIIRGRGFEENGNTSRIAMDKSSICGTLFHSLVNTYYCATICNYQGDLDSALDFIGFDSSRIITRVSWVDRPISFYCVNFVTELILLRHFS